MPITVKIRVRMVGRRIFSRLTTFMCRECAQQESPKVRNLIHKCEIFLPEEAEHIYAQGFSEGERCPVCGLQKPLIPLELDDPDPVGPANVSEALQNG